MTARKRVQRSKRRNFNGGPITWIGGYSNKWEDYQNWDNTNVAPGGVGATGEDVVIGNATIVITDPTPKQIASLTVPPTNTYVGLISQTTGVLILGSLILNGPFVIIQTQFTVENTLNITSNGVCTITGGSITNNGIGTWSLSADPVYAQGGFSFTNYGTFTCYANKLFGIDYTVDVNVVPPTFINNAGGVIIGAVGDAPGVCTIGMILTNLGQINVRSGTLQFSTPVDLDAPAPYAGVFQVAADAVLGFSGDHAFGPDSSVQGPGEVDFNTSAYSSNCLVSCSYNVSNTVVNGPEVRFEGATFADACSIAVKIGFGVLIGGNNGYVTIGTIA